MTRVVLISSPFGPETQSGNWRTAARYASLLGQARYVVRLIVGMGDVEDWRGVDVAVVLHARRSFAVAQRAGRDRIPYLVVLTGTDLYGDLGPNGSAADRSVCIETLRGALAAIVLQREAKDSLEQALREWDVHTPIHTILQTSSWTQVAEPAEGAGTLRCLMVGHIRPEKDPLTGIRGFLTAQAVCSELRLVHLGGSLDETLTLRMHDLAREHPDVLSLQGAVTHACVRDWMDRSDILIHPSRAEGGALVIAEAISRNLVVLASRIPGNWGVLGGDYPGLFEAGQPNALAELLVRLQRDVGLCSQLREAIHALRGRLCSPQAELQALVDAIEASALSRP
ncbi:MAG: hypothetical protein RLY30_1835 [Pseudomonadota bacterium]|jgi:glycosyltransferase involved in cell wall biosynthesis